jgi:two-component system response regulator AtoC
MQRDYRSLRIVVAEDELEVRSYFETVLRCQGYAVDTAQDGDEVLAYLQERNGESGVQAVLLAFRMAGKDGISILREIRSFDKQLPVIMISADASPHEALEARRAGATDLLVKPVNHEDLSKAVAKVVEGALPSAAVAIRRLPLNSKGTFFGANPRMREIEALAAQIGSSEATVLIQGETGSGKEMLARHLHAVSRRANRPFLKLNCAALPSELVESELFGYEKGAFTGAFQKKSGMFEIADGGTILLDEIGDMDFKLQAKLLQVLQDSEFQRVGGKETIHVDVRVIAATHADLEGGIAKKTFREDLFYRLNVINLRLPPLRERKDDILGLAEIFLQKHSAPGNPAPVLTAPLQRALINHSWPGNIRELENVIRKFIVLGNANLIISELQERAMRSASSKQNGVLPAPQSEPAAPASPILEQVTKAKEEAESEAIKAALNATHWNRKQAAALLKIDYKALLYKMKKLGLEDAVSISAASKRRISSESDASFIIRYETRM